MKIFPLQTFITTELLHLKILKVNLKLKDYWAFERGRPGGSGPSVRSRLTMIVEKNDLRALTYIRLQEVVDPFDIKRHPTLHTTERS